MNTPPIQERVQAVEDCIRSMRQSYTHTLGEEEGKVTDPIAARDIARLEAALETLKMGGDGVVKKHKDEHCVVQRGGAGRCSLKGGIANPQTKMKMLIRFLSLGFAGLLVAFCVSSCGTVSDEARDAANQQQPFIPDPANSPAMFPANY